MHIDYIYINRSGTITHHENSGKMVKLFDVLDPAFMKKL